MDRPALVETTVALLWWWDALIMWSYALDRYRPESEDADDASVLCAQA